MLPGSLSDSCSLITISLKAVQQLVLMLKVKPRNFNVNVRVTGQGLTKLTKTNEIERPEGLHSSSRWRKKKKGHLIGEGVTHRGKRTMGN